MSIQLLLSNKTFQWKPRTARLPLNSTLCIKKMRFLYRYYSNIDYALDVVKNRRMYFSLQSEFNDPFDCLPKFSLLACKNDGVQYWSELLRLGELYNDPSISEIELEAKTQNTLNGRTHPSIEWLKGYEQEREQAIKERLKGIRICCFAQSPRNQMLWAHYASNHSGLVFQFRTKYMADGETGERKMFPVTYYEKPISLPEYIKIFKAGFDDPLEYARFQYCSKSKEWSGENEVRLFSKQQHVEFPEQMLSGIIFGVKTPGPEIEKLNNRRLEVGGFPDRGLKVQQYRQASRPVLRLDVKPI